MKLSLNSILELNKVYKTADNIAPNGVEDLVTRIGAQLGEVEEVIDFGAKYEGVIIVKVVECIKHPDADKLSLCRVDDGGVAKDVERGDDGLVQVVCGAPNVREGLLAAWLPPGATVPSTFDDDPFVLEARELRGKVSNGMLASPKELALGDGHDGILEVDKDVAPGTAFDEAYKLKGEVIIDIENKMFTHRPDCFGLLGVSRELAGIQGIPFKSPDWYVTSPEFPSVEGETLPLEVVNELPELVPRFTAITMTDIKVGPSPVWLQVALAKLGQKSINNIVDLTNFYMLLTAQPLHAYDYDKVKALSEGTPKLIVRKPNSGEKIKLLNGKEITPREEAIMIASEKQLIGVGGIMGGSEIEVDEQTTNIIIECANFDMYSTRRTSMAHGLFTDASTRFTKGQSPLQNLAVQAKIISDIMRMTSGKVASVIIDDNHVASKSDTSLYAPVEVGKDFINSRLGLDLSDDKITEILQNVEFNVNNSGDKLTITAPFWRTDIEIPEDIVEEVGRLYGYDKLPLELPKRDLTPAVKDPLLTLKAEIRTRLSKAGANEVLSYSFVHGNLLDKVGQDKDQAFEISNALSPDLQYYRMSLVPSLLDKVHPNIKAGYDEFAIFELGKTHSLQHQTDEDGLPKEFNFTSLVVTAADKLKKPGSAYYQARKYLETLVGDQELEFKPVPDEMQAYAVTKPYEPKRSALVSIKGGNFLGIIGEFRQSVTRGLKLPKRTAGFEIDTEELLSVLSAGPNYAPQSRFPGIKQDITIKVPATLNYSDLQDFIQDELIAKAPKDSTTSLAPADIYQKQEDLDSKQVTFRIGITGDDRTLTYKEANTVLDSIAESLANKFGAERI